MESGSRGRLNVDSVTNIGPHYARTLREWKRKFLANWEGTVKKALIHDYDLGETELEIFRRKWICACIFSSVPLKPNTHTPSSMCRLFVGVMICSFPALTY